jgi:AbrB family looped-hinge helix DNA binding protein
VATARVGRKGQIALPSAIVRQLHLEEGDRVSVTVQGGAAVLRPVARTLLDMRGSVKVNEPQPFESIRRCVLHEHAREVSQKWDLSVFSPTPTSSCVT